MAIQNFSPLQLNSTLSVGVDDTGHDVTFFGATSGKKMLWDQSADTLVVDGTLDVNGNASIITGGGSGTLTVGRNANENMVIFVDDLNTKITGVQDSDTNGAHNFILNRTFAGSGANNFIIQKGGTAQLTLDTNGAATFAGNVTAGSNSLTAGSLDINGSADISGNLTGLDNVTSTNFIIGGHTIDDVDVAGEFVDSAAHLLTSAAALDKFHVLNADTTGNADTATLLETERAINGVGFDGSAAITVTAAAGTLSGNTLKSSVVTSSLTSVGTIATGVWNGTVIASAKLDADTAHLTTNQTFTGVKTFDETIVGSVNGSAATVATIAGLAPNTATTQATQAAITTLAGVTSLGVASATTNIAAGDITMYNPVNNGNPSISIGSSASESFKLSAVYESGAQGLDIVQFESFTGGSSSNDARYSFKVDETFLMQIKDAGIQIKASGALEIGNGNAILSDSSGTTTLGNIDALDATTIATIKAAVKNVIHYDFQGYATGDGSNYEMVNNLTDTNAPFEHNISLGSDGTTATTVQNIIRSGGKTMPRACTLKRWTGWAAAAGGQTAYVALFKVTPTRNDSTNLSAVLLDAFSYTALGNAKMEDFDETSFTATAIAAGDILITAMKSQSGAIHYFTSTVEVEF